MNRFILQKSQTRQNGWVCTDTDNGIVCEFEDKNFNYSQKFTILQDADNQEVSKIAKVVMEMGDWLRENHYKKAMP